MIWLYFVGAVLAWMALGFVVWAVFRRAMGRKPQYSHEQIKTDDYSVATDLVYAAFEERRRDERLRGESTTYIERHDPTVRRFHQAGGYE
jgi:hypothetical protein